MFCIKLLNHETYSCDRILYKAYLYNITYETYSFTEHEGSLYHIDIYRIQVKRIYVLRTNHIYETNSYNFNPID